MDRSMDRWVGQSVCELVSGPQDCWPASALWLLSHKLMRELFLPFSLSVSLLSLCLSLSLSLSIGFRSWLEFSIGSSWQQYPKY